MGSYRSVRLMVQCIAVFGFLLFCGPVRAVTRAIVIASSYSKASDPRLILPNSIADAKKISRSFREAGVKDEKLIEEPNEYEWEQAITELSSNAKEDDILIVYYAGHGVQVRGRNYFVVSDGKTLISVDQLIQRLTGLSKATIMIVDACRNNPFSDPDTVTSLKISDVGSSRTRSLGLISTDTLLAAPDGLTQIGELRGMSAVVFFSTEPGNVALDGEPGDGSPFANVLAGEILRRQSIDAMFRRTAARVYKATDQKQSPWRQGDLPFDVYLAGLPLFPIP